MGSIKKIARNRYVRLAGGNMLYAGANEIRRDAGGSLLNYALEGVHQKAPKIVDADYEAPQEEEALNFNIQIELLKEKREFVVLGVKSFDEVNENSVLTFKIIITGDAVDRWELTVKKGNIPVFTTTSEEVNNSISETWVEGEYLVQWDGFDNGGVFDSALFDTDEPFRAEIRAEADFAFKTAVTKNFSFERKEVSWVDVRINKNTMRIDATLRVNLTDGGAQGLNSGNRVPHERISFYNRQPLTTRSKSFDDLLQMALDGIYKYWSRHQGNIGNGIDIEDKHYEIFVSAINTSNNSMPSPEIIFNTNGKPGRSRNWELSRKLYYNDGYLQGEDRWIWPDNNYINNDFQHTSAHEIGHEILLAYGGHRYSKKHKGTSTLMQSTIPNTPYPTSGEIDIMKYSDEAYYPRHFFDRSVAAEKDVLSLIWLTKLELK
ncbi:hypothetical protein [Sinomicrobium sp.]